MAKEKKVKTKVKVEPKITQPPVEDEDRIVPPPDLPEDEPTKKDEPADYLKKYETETPARGSKAERMKEHLLKQPRVKIFIPKDPGESEGSKQSVGMNNYNLLFPKNTYLEMPQQVAELIMNSLKQTTEALKQFRIEGKEKEEALL